MISGDDDLEVGRVDVRRQAGGVEERDAERVHAAHHRGGGDEIFQLVGLPDREFDVDSPMVFYDHFHRLALFMATISTRECSLEGAQPILPNGGLDQVGKALESSKYHSHKIFYDHEDHAVDRPATNYG
jgi:hypothetical protein